MHYVSCLDQHWVEVHYQSQAGSEEGNLKINALIAAFSTCLAHLDLYDALERLGKRILYYDTHSVIYAHREGGKHGLAPGMYLRQFTSEPDSNQYIIEFRSGGLKIMGTFPMTGRLHGKSRDTASMWNARNMPVFPRNMGT